eukprot:Nitzschia sp. Nitz4//scaffold3_size479765//348396//349829//NITZ4_000145-RA/size479765-processed-gene-1.251-mRNA-1//1//CDS//3329550893//4097//frame0
MTSIASQPSRSLLESPVIVFLANNYLAVGLFLRLFLAWFLTWLLDSGRILPNVAYTDIDFWVFTDAANYLSQGKSPYDRHTYRYTPFLAELLSRLPHREWARFLFCIADALCAWLLRQLMPKKQTQPDVKTATNDSSFRPKQTETWGNLVDAMWWAYNPLAINICTRGSAESLMVLLPVLLTLYLVQLAKHSQTLASSTSVPLVILAGISHGVAIHSKLYPIIYSLSYMASLSNSSTSFDTGNGASLLLSVEWYGQIALQEGLLYHFSRVDHRHNYSMFWYWIYLSRARATNQDILALMGRLLLLPQVVLLVYTSLGIAPTQLSLALFLQTYLFVTHNKVITAQYFTWYLCLLPLCAVSFRWTRDLQRSLMLLGVSILTWLGSAYCLEMLGLSAHIWVWLASVLYFLANVNLMGALLRSHSQQRTEVEMKKKV